MFVSWSDDQQFPVQTQPISVSPVPRSTTPLSSSGKRKKPRTSFTSEQIYEMEKKFRVQKYLAATERAEFAEKLKLTDTQVS